MNPDRQKGRFRLPRWALMALVLSAVGVAIAQTAEAPPTDEEVQSVIDKATAVPFPALGGPRAAGVEGEISLGSMRSLYSQTDVTVKGALGAVSFVRYYGLDTRDHTSRDVNQRPHWTPFGSMRADTSADLRNGLINDQCGTGAEERNDCKGGLRWWHNFESWVEYREKERPCRDEPQVCNSRDPEYDVTWFVHAPDGRIYTFPACSLYDTAGQFHSKCYARNLSDPDVKLALISSSSSFGDGFVLYTPTARYVYAEPWNSTNPPEAPPYPGMVRARLSYVLAPERATLDGGATEDSCPEFGPYSPCQRRLATLHYGPVCLSDKTAVRNVLDTYVTHIDVAGAGTLALLYKSVYLRDRKQLVNVLADGGTDGKYIPPKECVLSKILLTAPEGDATPAREVVSYGYAQGPFEDDTGTTTQTLGGLLSDVVVSPAPILGGVVGIETRLHYEYVEAVLPKDGGTSLQPLRTFRVLRNGLLERELVLDASDGSYVKQAQVGDTKVHLWAANNGVPQDGGYVPYCHPGNFTNNRLDSAQRKIACDSHQWQYQQAELVLAGDGNGSLVPGVQQGTKLGTANTNPYGPIVGEVELQCASGTCNALAPQQRSRSWAVQGYDPCDVTTCSPNEYPYYSYAPSKEVDTRGNKLVLASQLAPLDAGVPPSTSALPVGLPHVEVHTARAGATQDDGSDALQTRHFTYAYVGNYQQKLKDEWGASALHPFDTYQVRRHYDARTGRLTAFVRSGYTLQFVAGANTFTTVLRHVGTFYRHQYSCTMAGQDPRTRMGAGDAMDRVVEVAGPCWVSGPDAQECLAEQPSVPITQYEYWPATAAPRLAGHLAVRRVFSRTAGNGTCDMPDLAAVQKPYVETYYDDYDTQGRLTQWRNANGTVTKYIYSGDKLVEARVADGTPLVAVTKYGYDNGDGTGNWVLYPEGRYEVQCFRKNTAPGTGCRGGVLTDKLQWKATSRSPDGWVYSERTDYVYAANGQMVGEVVSDKSGAVRRKRYFEGDPLGRTTYEATGSTEPGAPSNSRYHQVSLFDMEGNRVGLGRPYQPTSSPLQPLCGGFAPQSTQANALPASPLCKLFEYDRLNRLSRLTEPLDTEGTEGATTCLTYDKRGNLASVSRVGPNQICAPDSQASVRYVHDDFGNLVQVRAPWARAPNGLSGGYQYAYDAAGNLTLKQTPAMAHSSSATWVQYSYDAMNRLLTAQAGSANDPTHPQTLYAYAYDGQVAPPNFCPGGAGNSDGEPLVKGLAQVLTDSFGDTWYVYDVHGRPKAHWRVRGSGQPPRTQACGRANTPNTPNRWFYYDASGRLINEVLPGGRPLHYVYHDVDSSMPHRVREVRAALWDGSAWGGGGMTLLKDAQWEPYGGLKSYAIQTHLSTGTGTTLWRYVDYWRTATATVPLSRCNVTNIVTGNDYTGRLKAVTVSTEAARNASQPGDIYKRVYTWKADQVVREDTCVLETGDVAPETVQYAGAQGEAGYDTRGQLRHVTGRPYDLRTYAYNALGNRLSERRGDFLFQMGYAPETGGVRAELLRTRSISQCASGDSSCQQATALTSPIEQYAYDDDGRVLQKAWIGDAQVLAELNFNTALDGAHAAVGAVYRSVSDDQGRTWEYFYDAVGRRRLKLHMEGATEEYFYDETHLLEDWGVTSLYPTQADSVRDEYIWLDGSPVALFKTRVNRTGGRVSDFTGTCERHSDDVKPACGVYFPVTDMLGKPVLMLDGAGLVTGVADYDAFGHVNRISHPAESPHPSLAGNGAILFDGSNVLPVVGSHLRVHVRGRFSLLQGRDGGEAFLTNGSDVRLSPVVYGGTTSISGTAGRFAVTPWAWASGVSQLRVYFTELHWGGESEDGPWGASLEGLEYRRFQSGATPVWLPLRLPGQYYDAETDLFENWNRYYDANTGLYSAPEPMWMEPVVALSKSAGGRPLSVYGFAGNNPVAVSDPTGLMEDSDLSARVDPPKDICGYQSSNECERQARAMRSAGKEIAWIGAEVGLSIAYPVPMLAAIAISVLTPADSIASDPAIPTKAEFPSVPGLVNSGQPESLFRSGDTSPSSLKLRPGEEGLSFRDSLSNPVSAAEAPVFRPGKPYIEIDPMRLPAGTVVPDGVPHGSMPHGHVTVKPASGVSLVEMIKTAWRSKGKLP